MQCDEERDDDIDDDGCSANVFVLSVGVRLCDDDDDVDDE